MAKDSKDMPHPGHEQHLCHLSGQNRHRHQPQEYAQLVKNPKFVCKSCGRVAGEKGNLCEPVLLGTWEQ